MGNIVGTILGTIISSLVGGTLAEEGGAPAAASTPGMTEAGWALYLAHGSAEVGNDGAAPAPRSPNAIKEEASKKAMAEMSAQMALVDWTTYLAHGVAGMLAPVVITPPPQLSMEGTTPVEWTTYLARGADGIPCEAAGAAVMSATAAEAAAPWSQYLSEGVAGMPPSLDEPPAQDAAEEN